MSNNVLVVGGGGREHALAWKLSRSTHVSKVYVSPGNGGTALCSPLNIFNVDLPLQNHERVAQFCQEKRIQFVVVGPEQPLSEGLVNYLSAAGVKCFGPTKEASMIEASKAFSKDFMARHNIPTAAYRNFTNKEDALQFVRTAPFPVVVKASGLAAGKGVVVPKDVEEALKAVEELSSGLGKAGETLVIEERLEGEEVSLLAFSDGQTVIVMPPAQDHKRAHDGDEGPNTGGMGAYAPSPLLSAEEVKSISKIALQRAVDGMKKEGIPFVGVLYAGIMIQNGTRAPYVLEYNCRFGDPECQVLLPLLKSDLYEVIDACLSQRLHLLDVKWFNKYASTVVMASKGYPGAYAKGHAITGIDMACKEVDGVTIFHAGTSLDGASIKNTGGRVLAVTSVQNTLPESVSSAYQAVSFVTCEALFYRKDIANRALTKYLPALEAQKKQKKKTAILISGSGTNMEALIKKASSDRNYPTEIALVISNKEDAKGLEKAAKAGIKTIVIKHQSFPDRKAFEMEIDKHLEAEGIEFVCLAGFMRILSAWFVEKWKYKVLNIHPSLLPSFKGMHAHKLALEAGVRVTGCSVHFVLAEVDAGPIIVQKVVDVMPGDTEETLSERVKSVEHIAFPLALELVTSGEVVVVDGKLVWRQ